MIVIMNIRTFHCSFTDKEEENKETKREDKLLAQIEKLSKVSKRETKERKVYIPPALKKTGMY